MTPVDEMKPDVTQRAVRTAALRTAVRVLVAGALLVAVLPGASASAAPIEDARTQVGEAQRAADAAAARYEAAIGRLEEIGSQIAGLEMQIMADKTEAAALCVVAQQRAVRA